MPTIKFHGSKELNSLAFDAMEKLALKYGNPECGRNRATFLSHHFVIKFPLNKKGIADNIFEGTRYSRKKYYAKGRIININGFKCVIQERLKMPKLSERVASEWPSWVSKIDCGQVGFDRKGNLKAYDFGPN